VAIEGALGIKVGQTTPDGRFTLEEVNCIGACGRAPAMMIDERRFDGQTTASVAAVLASFA
jgi:NADH:ubiquinone oxidoreductase subunit E